MTAAQSRPESGAATGAGPHPHPATPPPGSAGSPAGNAGPPSGGSPAGTQPRPGAAGVRPEGVCAGRVVIVTGGGRGIGRAHALAFARAGARVVVNDLGVARDGSRQAEDVPQAPPAAAANPPGHATTPTAPGVAAGAQPTASAQGRAGPTAATAPPSAAGPAEDVAAMIRADGGQAVPNSDDVASFEGAARLIQTAVDAFGRLDVLVNNAGFVRDRMLVSMTEAEWDDVIRVHLKGHFAPLRHAAAYWRERARSGAPVDAAVINTSSGAGLLGSVGQASYSAAKAGIATLTLVAAAELGRYGVTVNAIAPSARTRMTEQVFAEMMAKPDSGFDAMDPANVSPLVVWLASPLARHITGRVFEVEGGVISVADGWRHGPRAGKGARWDPAEIGPVVDKLIAAGPPPDPVYGAPR